MHLARRLLRPASTLAILSLAALPLVSCGRPDADQGGNPPSVTASAPVIAQASPPGSAGPLPAEPPEPAPLSGLTGLPADSLPLPRPLAVMINNAPAARPQSGLSEADLLYEVLAEGGITRLIAIYQSRPGIPEIGPVRSIRPYLLDLGESYGAVTVHAGGSPAAYALLQAGGRDDMDEIGKAGPYFWRDKSRKAPHNLYTNEALLRSGAEKLGLAAPADVPDYTFTNPDYLPAGGEPASGFSLYFQLKNYTVAYKYEAGSRVYARSVNGKAHLDRGTEAPVTATNVLVIGADHKVLDEAGRLAVDTEVGGDALLFQRGQVIRGQWVRRPGDIIRIVKNGTEAPMYPGVTHVLIVPNAPSFDSHVTVLSP
ncbi:DUF3048 domain-containing protein [Paenibacillus spiritus]|uniref:DUF3048 domain-containing protein n=1 Tax=Paenibacillus spiritus TaxID=2496557 RepID=A0A5J5FTN7_9BACL|nr:DUF3048 domain-containing protein [Paenibacillus spiritus]KAA8996851.1 DUF3048 domain-containing protein [Paenibacillus spiritus]